ncbi:MAG TPA: serine hydrolase domain-containing protein, partial [Gaiellaceae bacterium]|nr:serine hydrolase domain-containing protein [Gaiellaceae bacterium]
MSGRRKLLLALILAPLAALGIVIGIDRAFFAQSARTCPFHATESSRPALQRILDGAVSGPSALAPGATAFVSGPHGTWSSAAGVADTSTCARMTADARMRLESVSKIYTAALVLQLAQEGRLRVGDTVERWLPGLLPYGRRITIRELLTMTSGLIDNNDFTGATDAEKRASLARVKDPKVRARLYAIATRVGENPATTFSDLWWIRWAAAQPLVSPPGTLAHYSNIGYDILGRIAARAAGKPLPELYREQIFAPLALRATAYDPQGPIAGPHARGYGIEPDGTRIDTTDWHAGVAAEGGIVSDAKDTATFLTA